MKTAESDESSKALVQDGGEISHPDDPVLWPIEALESLVDQYPTPSAIQQRLDEIEEEIETLEAEIKAYQETQAEKRQELKEYGSDEDIKTAQATIDKARGKFERLYEEYPINRIGEALTQRLYRHSSWTRPRGRSWRMRAKFLRR